MIKNKNEITRGLFIDFEGFTPSKTDEYFIKKISTKLSSTFKLFIFNDIPKEKQTEMKYIQRESPKMFNRASLMLSAHSRELKRMEMLEELTSGNNIITINYCFDKILKALNDDLDINFAKKLFRGMIRPDIVIYHNCPQNSDEFFGEYKMIKKFEKNSDNNNTNNNSIDIYEKEISELYQNTLDFYSNWKDNYKKNYFPNSIGEDLFIEY